MADGKIVVESKQIVLRIHERLKKEIHKMVETKSWSAEQKREFEKKLLELYRVSVEEKVKENVVVGGQEWNNSTQTEVSSDSVFLHEEMEREVEPFNKDKFAELFMLCSQLGDLLVDTTSKRKKYPQQITEGLRKILQSHKDMLEKYQPPMKNDSLTSFNVLMPDFEECFQKLQSASHSISLLSKSFPELHEKAARLQQVVQSHNALQKNEIDAALFGRDGNRNVVHMSSASASQLNNELPLKTSDSTDFIFCSGSKWMSQPPQRFDAS